ncbi:hypothetical protein BV22DRAFT_115357 [Leucogyrophana mollusca]|uniref:Uncharacterized protein n=1 Tax=Leucogyrophana mollusca TaxID=85980 RepID=A0ACB8BX54_9AGAM|nr:hypothetical protein BV22DRAFT_115357 [Leucogyrophana mollusca]
MGASREPQAEGHESAEPDCTALPPGPEVSGPPRQRGCQEYEALSGVEKLDYCVNVLLPEAVQQILLWRSGDRTSVELLSPEEEQTLHDIGVRKGNETDWVFDVLRMREAQARIIQNKSTSSAVVLPPGTSTPTGGTRSRPRRGTVTSAR